MFPYSIFARFNQHMGIGKLIHKSMHRNTTLDAFRNNFSVTALKKIRSDVSGYKTRLLRGKYQMCQKIHLFEEIQLIIIFVFKCLTNSSCLLTQFGYRRKMINLSKSNDTIKPIQKIRFVLLNLFYSFKEDLILYNRLSYLLFAGLNFTASFASIIARCKSAFLYHTYALP